MVNCSDFLEAYSGFRDGVLDPRHAAAMEAHLTSCASCQRYDRVIESGVETFRELPGIEPSYDFLPRLKHRIYHLEDDWSVRERRSSGASLALTLTLAAAIGLTAWAPLLRPRPAVVQLPPIAAHAPHRVEALHHLFRAGPLLAQPRVEQLGSSTPPSIFHQYTPLGTFASNPTPPVQARVP